MPSDPRYRHRRWRKLRRAFLTRSSWCVLCERSGRCELATVVDHVVPHKGDSGLFWDVTNLQSLCKPCHDSRKATLERSGRVIEGANADGYPFDPDHPWNVARREAGAPGAVSTLRPEDAANRRPTDFEN